MSLYQMIVDFRAFAAKLAVRTLEHRITRCPQRLP
jgi:hypothetical protein